ncbi:MAG: hypothetical protein WC688_07245 [Parachlamydiales bacterium]|jgi:hypothetical protein
MEIRKVLIEKINSSNWWHVRPQDKKSYKKRGKFLASTYKQAEFYGKPNLESEKVAIKNPIYGFSELEILTKLFGENAKKLLDKVLNADNCCFYNERTNLDAKIFEKARKSGYDSIVLMTKIGKNILEKGKKPNSIELNLLNI